MLGDVAGLSAVPDVPAAFCERRAAPREAGPRALGSGERLPGVPAVHIPALPHPKVRGQDTNIELLLAWFP